MFDYCSLHIKHILLQTPGQAFASLNDEHVLRIRIGLCIQTANLLSVIERMAGQCILLILALEGALRNSVSGAAFVSDPVALLS